MSREVAASGVLIGELGIIGIDRLQARLELVGNVDHKAGTDVEVQSRIDDFERTVRRQWENSSRLHFAARSRLFAALSLQLQLAEAGQKTSLVAESRACVVIAMTPLPVGKNHNSRPMLTEKARDLKTAFPGVLHSALLAAGR